MKSKILIQLLLVVMLFSVFTGCSNDSKKQEKKVETSQLAELLDNGKPDPVDFTFYLGYSWFTLKYPYDDQNEISKWIIENFGVNITYTWPSGDEKEKMNLMIQSDSLPEVMMIERDDMYYKLIELGQVLPLDSYIKKYSGYRGMVEEQTRKMAEVDGKSYSILNWPLTNEWLGFGSVPIINVDIYKQLGSPKLDTLKDFENYLKMVRESNLKVNGKDVIPLQFAYKEQNLWSSYGEERISNELGGNHISYRPLKDGKLGLTMTDPKFEEMIVTLNRFYNLGYLSKGLFIEKTDQIKEQLATGRIAVYIGSNASSDVMSANKSAKKTGINLNYEGIPVPIAEGVDRATVKTVGKEAIGWNSIVITKNAKQPERIFKYLDWVMSTEGQRITEFGPKGILWDEIDEEGVPILKEGKTLALTLDETKKLPLSQFQTPGHAAWADMAKMRIAARYPSEQQSWDVNYQIKNELWKLVTNSNSFTQITPKAGTEEQIIFNNVSQYYDDQYPKMILSKDEATAKVVLKEAIEQIYKLGFKKIEDYSNTIWQENKSRQGIK